MMRINVSEKAIGAQSIDQALAQIEAKIGKRIMRQALRKAGNVVRDEARNRSPVQSGLMRRKITTRVGYSRREQAWGAQVGVFGAPRAKAGKTRKEHPFYARWVERGHAIVPRRRSKTEGFSRTTTARNADGSLRLTRQWISRKQAREDAHTSGRRVAPRPFVGPSLIARQGEVHRVLMADLRSGLDEALRQPL